MCSGWPCRVWSRLVASVCGDDVLLDCFVVRLPLFLLVGLLEGVLSVAGEGEIYLRGIGHQWKTCGSRGRNERKPKRCEEIHGVLVGCVCQEVAVSSRSSCR